MGYPNPNEKICKIDTKILLKICDELDICHKWKDLNSKINPRYALRMLELETKVEMQAASTRSSPSWILLLCYSNKSMDVSTLMDGLHEMKLETCLLPLKKIELLEIMVPPVASQTITEGCAWSVSCDADGFPYPHYQWFKGQTKLIGEIHNVLKIDHVQLSDKGSYVCRVHQQLIINGRPHYKYEFSSRSAMQVIPDKSKVGVSDSKPYTATDKVALLIGNGYCDKELPAAENDIGVFKNILKKEDFTVISLLDLTHDEILNAVDEFTENYLKDGVYAVFYFIGHGYERDSQCYLTPRKDKDIRSVCAEEIIAKIQKYNTALTLIMLDICRKELPKGHQLHEQPVIRYTPEAKGNSVTIYATSPGLRSYEYNSADVCCGLLMAHLCKVLYSCRQDQKQLDVYDMFKGLAGSMTYDPLLRKNMQLPEIRADLNMCERSIFDLCRRDYYQEIVHRQQINRYHSYHCVPDPFRRTAMATQIVLSFECRLVLSNMLFIHIVITSMGKTQALEITDGTIPSNFLHTSYSEDEMKNFVKFCPDQQLNGRYIMKIGNLQNLKGDFNVDLSLRYTTDGVTYQSMVLPVEFKCSLISNLNLGRVRTQDSTSNTLLMGQKEISQHNIEGSRKSTTSC